MKWLASGMSTTTEDRVRLDILEGKLEWRLAGGSEDPIPLLPSGQSYAPSATETSAVDDNQQPDDFPYDEWVNQSPGDTKAPKAKQSSDVSTGED